MVEVYNQQRKIKLDRPALRAFAEAAAGRIEETGNKNVTIVFVSDRRMRELNRMFRGKTGTTDVLSFPFEPDEFEPASETLGEIAVSAEQAARQAAENGLSFETELRQLILRGLLHLCGYDHETDDGEMNRRELEMRELLGIAE